MHATRRGIRGILYRRSPDRRKSLDPGSERLARMRIFAALGALAFSSYRPSKFSAENALSFAVFTRQATTRGSQMQLPNFSDRMPANAVLKTCKNFKVIHAFRIFAFHVFCALLPTGFRRVLSRRRSSQLGGVWSIASYSS
jgi:hypothetical protein